MFEIYGTDVETFAVCQDCGKIWECRSDLSWVTVDALPISAIFIPSYLCLDFELPSCCEE